MDGATHLLRDLAVIMTVAAVTTVASQRARLPVIVGYLVAGLLTGIANPFRLVDDLESIRALSELGVVLLMFSIGLGFRLGRLARLVPVVGLAAAIEIGLMFGLGYLTGRLAGWSGEASVFAGAIVSVSSTMIVGKAFEDRKPTHRLEDLVLGVLLMEDLAAILLLVLLTARSTGPGPGVEGLVGAGARLVGFLALLVAGGLLVVPRAMRAVVALRRHETTVVAAVGVAFLFALLARQAGYSVALGGFVAGALVRESGAGFRVAELLRPIRDLFAALFFVAVGMLVRPGAVAAAWPVVVALTLVVLAGKVAGVTLGGFFAGFGVRTSVQAGMTLAQIGEFSFVIAGLGLAAGTVPASLYPVAVSVSVLTALLTPLLLRLADPLAALLDRNLPRPAQTFVALYESWIELIRRRPKRDTLWRQIRGPVRWMILDAASIGGLVVALARLGRPVMAPLRALGVPDRALVPAALALGLAAAAPFAIGLVTSARRLAVRLAEAAMPRVPHGVDQANAPRRLLEVAIHFASVVGLGLPLLALTQPFLTVWPAVATIGSVLLILTVTLWHAAKNLQGHAVAGAELVVDVLARQGIDKDEHSLEVVQELLPGMGTIVPFHVGPASGLAGRTLGELNLRALAGVTVVALSRRNHRVVFPKGTEVLQAGDDLALIGSHDAIEAAHRLLAAGAGADSAPTPA